ncbi:MAG: hypothetical protein GXY14_10780 [Spirochaetes bacterium]|nr:hypothetical protein [Spirochaetota bacterium]
MKRLFFIFLLLPVTLHTTETADAVKRQKKFITGLYSSGDYFNAIAEARKLQHGNNDRDIEYFIHTCYYLAGQYWTVTGQYKPGLDGNKYLPFMLLVSQSFIRLEDYTSAYSLLGPLSYDGFEQKAAFNLLLRRVEPLVLSGDFEPLDSELLSASQIMGDYPDYIQLKHDLESFRENQGISPVTGAIMSAIMPGLGQLWSGRITDALLSLASVALPAVGACYMKDNGHNGTAYTLYFFTSLFYAGNIYGGYNSARLHEKENCKNNHEKLEKRYGRYDPAIYLRFGRDFN